MVFILFTNQSNNEVYNTFANKLLLYSYSLCLYDLVLVSPFMSPIVMYKKALRFSSFILSKSDNIRILSSFSIIVFPFITLVLKFISFKYIIAAHIFKIVFISSSVKLSNDKYLINILILNSFIIISFNLSLITKVNFLFLSKCSLI